MKELTDRQVREIEYISKIRDEDIDFSEIPRVTDFTRFEKGPLPEYLKRRREHSAEPPVTRSVSK